VGQAKQSDTLLNSSGGSKQNGGACDGPRNVYIKLNKVSDDNTTPFQFAHAIKKTLNPRVHPIPAIIRKQQQQLINNLHLRTSASSSTQPIPLSSSSGMEVDSIGPIGGDVAVHRNPPYRIKPRKQRENSQWSAGGVLCCSSLDSSDIRNCNKRFVAQLNHEAAQKVWNGAIDLGVVGDEGDEFYVKRILINENSEKEARNHREQLQQTDP
jgi:hypothetical protein